MRELASGLSAQLRVIHAVALRETRTRFGKHRFGYLWALIEPALWIATFYVLFALVGRHTPDGMELIPFLATGIVTYSVFTHTTNRGAESINGNKALLYFPQVQTLDLIAARGVLEMATYAVVFGVILGGHAMVSQELAIDNALMVIAGFGLSALLGISLGLVFCALGVVFNTLDRIRQPLMRPLFWISGLFFTANTLPTSAREILIFNPVLHCVELVRSGWFPQYSSQYADPTYVLAWILALSFVGLTVERGVRRRVQLT